MVHGSIMDVLPKKTAFDLELEIAIARARAIRDMQIVVRGLKQLRKDVAGILEFLVSLRSADGPKADAVTKTSAFQTKAVACCENFLKYSSCSVKVTANSIAKGGPQIVYGRDAVDYVAEDWENVKCKQLLDTTCVEAIRKHAWIFKPEIHRETEAWLRDETNRVATKCMSQKALLDTGATAAVDVCGPAVRAVSSSSSSSRALVSQSPLGKAPQLSPKLSESTNHLMMMLRGQKKSS